MVTAEPRQGFFSLVRWRADAARDEERNIGILLVDPESGSGALRPLPPSSFSSKLREQGILDAAVTALRERVEGQSFDVGALEEMHASFQRSLLITAPKPVAVTDTKATLLALYRAFVKGPPAGPRGIGKAAVMDQVAEYLRGEGWRLKRSEYIRDFIFDLVVEDAPLQDSPKVMSVLSFGGNRKDWSPIEKDAGHFLCGVYQLDVPGKAAIVPPSVDSSSDAKRAHDRVLHMLDRADVGTADVSVLLGQPHGPHGLIAGL